MPHGCGPATVGRDPPETIQIFELSLLDEQLYGRAIVDLKAWLKKVQRIRLNNSALSWKSSKSLFSCIENPSVQITVNLFTSYFSLVPIEHL